MNNKYLTIFATAICCSVNMAGQQTVMTYNALENAEIEQEGNSANPTIAHLTDGNDMTVFEAENVSTCTLVFKTKSVITAKGISVVAGQDLDKSPSRMTLYGMEPTSGEWKAIGRYTTGVTFEGPMTNFVGRTTSASMATDRFKLEISKIKSGTTLEIAEVQLLGQPEDAGVISTADNGSFSASENAENLWAVDGSNPATAVNFRSARVDYGVADSWLEYTFNEPVEIAGYSLGTNVNTSASSRPNTWELLASEDGEHWVTLDMRNNETWAEIDNYSQNFIFEAPGVSIDYASASDGILQVLDDKFYRDYNGGKYLIHSWNEDPEKINTGYNYWWMAHAIDAYIDAYQRTGENKYQIHARQIRAGMRGNNGLWNTFYDDMEWMALACIRGYETFKLEKESWLEDAIQLFDWIWEGWNYDDGTEGGIRWNHSDDGKGKNSCSNAPAMIAAARLYELTSEQSYLDKAIMIYEWMLTHSRFDDGFIKDAPNNENRGWAFTYNQGTWVGGLLELYKITGDEKYRDVAVDLMDKSLDWRWYSPNGIMREQGASDGGLFKGIYIRYITNWVLSGLLDSERQFRYAKYLVENAKSLYNCALVKPEYRVMPNWKNRAEVVNGETNGGVDGSYHASIALSGIFLFESVDMMRRAGLLNDDYSVINPAVGKQYTHYRLNVTDNMGAANMQIGAFGLLGKDSDAGIGLVGASSNHKASVKVLSGALELSVDEDSVVTIYDGSGVIMKEFPIPSGNTTVDCMHGFYIVKIDSIDNVTVSKIIV